MPSWPVHLAMANKLNGQLNLGDEFIFGNIVPDMLNGYIVTNLDNKISHNESHYKENKRINVESFLTNNKINNNLMLGFYTHLLTDAYFNNYFYNIKMKKNYTEKTFLIKQKDFDTFGKYLTYKKQLGKTISIKKYEDIPFKTSNEDISKTVNKINEYINANYFPPFNYEMFEEKELIKLYEECYNYILEKLLKVKNVY